ncbi:transglutaminase-like domain-containing protein [Leptonema illini]|uniref:Transglutaminase domain-containing protein n=1 Tax=Leptonema illini DSM 21528 TaxID=929563 RepID=H2CEQ6_9LEPT|nr:transglutaminase-like domain-containing protein [Leptonema illini]EHQ06668.1 transglutaminase domain-containing protein [Leptonema illini DSM 21528]
MFQKDSDDPSLSSTEFFDFESAEMQAFLDRVTPVDAAPLERLKAAYIAVRDGIAYNPYRIPLQREYYRASRICRMKRAYCIPKSLLFAACARALGFRSWIGLADVVNHLSSQRFIEYLGTNVFAYHGYAVVEVNGRRLKATPVFDAKLCAKFGVAPLDFDGENDALFQQYDGKGHRFMEYIRERGEFDEFPFEEVMRGLAEMYPHLIGNQVDGDFMNEAPAH